MSNRTTSLYSCINKGFINRATSLWALRVALLMKFTVLMAIISDDHNIMSNVVFSKAKSINYNGNLEVDNAIPSVKGLLIQKLQECYSYTETSEYTKQSWSSATLCDCTMLSYHDDDPQRCDFWPCVWAA